MSVRLIDAAEPVAQARTLVGATDPASFHERLAALLGFPDYYGRTLDALWDVLTDRDPDQPGVTVVWPDWAEVAVHRPDWWARLLDLLRDLDAEPVAPFTLLLPR